MNFFIEVRKVIIFFSSFIGLFVISKFVLIDTGVNSLIRNNGNRPLELRFGRTGLLLDQDDDSLFWGSVDNENFQDVYYRLSYLIEKKSNIKNVTIQVTPDLFAQKKFGGKGLERVIPYYPISKVFSRVFETGFSYELLINFLKYKLGIPFRSSREISLLLKGRLSTQERLPYFSRKVTHSENPTEYLTNIHYFWVSIEMIIENKIPLTLSLDTSSKFPQEISINKLFEKSKKLFKDKIRLIEI